MDSRWRRLQSSPVSLLLSLFFQSVSLSLSLLIFSSTLTIIACFPLRKSHLFIYLFILQYHHCQWWKGWRPIWRHKVSSSGHKFRSTKTQNTNPRIRPKKPKFRSKAAHRALFLSSKLIVPPFSFSCPFIHVSFSQN